jgi:hypothetical protein
MNDTLNTFSERVNEINLYYEALVELDKDTNNPSIELKDNPKIYRQDLFLKILQANTLIMIYNLVESTVLNGISEIYDKLKLNGATYSMVRKEIQDIWFSYKFRQVYDPKAHYGSYKNKALEIVNSILIGETIELSKDALTISGNLDADEIRKVCDSHGIDLHPNDTCKGGKRLNDVREKRNMLAHGALSFSECGRDFGLEDLNDIKEQSYIFLRGLLDGMKQYYESDGFLDRNTMQRV